MTAAWAARLPRWRAPSCAHLRLQPGVRAAFVADDLWLTGNSLDRELELALRAIPGLRRFSVLADERLAPADRSVPVARLPAAEWHLAATLFAVEAPPTPLPPSKPPPTRLSLVRADRERPTAALLVDLLQLADWAETAPDHRLRCLSFCVSGRARSLVCGNPLPPLPGIPLWRDGALLLPCGSQCDPSVTAALVATVLRSATQVADGATLFLFEPDGTFEAIGEEFFVHGSRASIRASAGRLPGPTP